MGFYFNTDSIMPTTGGAEINNQDITVLKNGTYTAGTRYYAYGANSIPEVINDYFWVANYEPQVGDNVYNSNIDTVTPNLEDILGKVIYVEWDNDEKLYRISVDFAPGWSFRRYMGTEPVVTINEDNYTGLGTVTVNTLNPSSGTVYINVNGTYDVTNYASAQINVPSGDIVQVTNNTGAAISAGDKVFLAPPASSSVMVSGLDTLPHFVSADGSAVYYDNSRYDVEDHSVFSSSEYPMSNDGGIVNGLRYTSLGMFAGPYQIVGLTLRVLDKIVLSENYGFEYYQGSSTLWYLYELNPSDLRSYTSRHNCTFNYNVDCRNVRLVVIGNKLYASQSSQRWVGEITSGVTDITMNERTDSLYVLYATSDNKCAICCDTVGSYDGTWNGVKLYNVNGSYELNGLKTSANSALNSLIANSNVIITFNNVTGILCLSVYGSGDYGCFRYNSATEDFDTVNIALSGQTASGYMMLTVTDDLNMVQYGNYLYTLAGGSYQAVSFANFTQAGYTGIATSNAASGADVTVKTVLE